MIRILPLLFILTSAMILSGQDVAIGHTAPVAKLDIRGVSSLPSIPGTNSTGTLRIGISSDAGIDIGKRIGVPFTAWIQSGHAGTITDPLSLNPLGGNVGIGTTVPSTKLEVAGQIKITGGSPGAGKVLTSDGNGLASWQSPPPPPPVYHQTVWICCNPWMTKNLDVAVYRNGDTIPHVTDPVEWASLTTGAYCYYNNDSATYAATYGKLYNWYAVNDSRGLAPEGWHLPTDFEWTNLGSCLGGAAIAGGPMKEPGTTHWNTPNTGGTNLSGFTGLPGGYRSSGGTFLAIGNNGFWWSSTEDSSLDAWYRYLDHNFVDLIRLNNHKRHGFSVRCLRD